MAENEDLEQQEIQEELTLKKSPNDFLKAVIGQHVKVRLNSQIEYRGVLAVIDGYMNIALEETEEYVEGQLKNKFGDCFIRGNNGSHLFEGVSMERSKSALKRDVLEQKNEIGPKLVIIMVGLPARGKSCGLDVCKKLCRYLSWLGFNTVVFNVGNKRRVMGSDFEASAENTVLGLGLSEELPKLTITSENDQQLPMRTSSPSQIGGTQHDANFFDPKNDSAKKWREMLATETLEELIYWLNHGGKVGILDATNSTIERRKVLCERVAKEKQMRIIFIESICTEGPILEENIEMKLSGPDYKKMERNAAIADFKARIAMYEKVYQTLGEEEEAMDVSYIKIINIGKKVITHNIHGYIQSQCVFYLMQLNIKKRTIWITRHGESYYNLDQRIGGDPPLTDNGKKYGVALGKFLKNYYVERKSEKKCQKNKQIMEGKLARTYSSPQMTDDNFGTSGNEELINVWTSTLRRTIETVESFDEQHFAVVNIKFLNEIYAGIFENLTYNQVKERDPVEFKARADNKLNYRYPGAGGESYVDVIERLRPLIIELERMECDTIICTHNVVMRTLVVYFLGLELKEMPNLNVPLHTVYKIEPTPYGANLTKYFYDVDADNFTVIQ
ncbi:hypothetical protein HDU92_004706 [Lobulomyces angularis]|nr:hypothetical protein HDU92_004706 [Lobulomyces angularis]